MSEGDSVAPAVDEARGPTSGLIARAEVGRRLAGFIYGTILVLSVVVAGARAYPDDPGHVAAIAVVTSVIFWLAHVYAHGLAESVEQGKHVSLGELGEIARREGSLVQAAVPPVVALLLGEIGILSAHTALWLAFGVGLVVLGVQGLVFARIERLGWAGTLAVVCANLALGFLLVALKLFVSH